jgi:hypothetical protein
MDQKGRQNQPQSVVKVGARFIAPLGRAKPNTKTFSRKKRYARRQRMKIALTPDQVRGKL